MTQVAAKANLVKLAELVSGIYSRETALLQAGLGSFSPGLRFLERFCETEDALDEYREMEIKRRQRLYVAPDQSFVQKTRLLTDHATKRFEETGNIWDLEVIKYRRKMQKMRATCPRELEQMLAPYRAETERLWADEVCLFSGKLGSNRQPDIDAIKDSLGVVFGTFGFTPVRKASASKQFVLSMPLPDSTTLCVVLDLTKFRLPILPTARIKETGQVIRSGPEFSLWLECRHGRDDPIRILFEDLFPIREGPVSAFCYLAFRDHCEAAALGHIYSKMFEIIQPKLLSVFSNEGEQRT